MSIGISFPFALATGSLGYFEATSDVVDAIRSNLRSLLLTNWGERVMHYDFGCNMREFLFEPRNAQLRGSIAERIKAQVSKWMPFLVLTELFVMFDSDDRSLGENGIKVSIKATFGNIPVNLFEIFPGG